MWIFYAIAYGIIWSIVCAKVMDNKGYDPGPWYLWGFLFGIFAFLVAATKEPYQKPVYSESETSLSRILREDAQQKEERNLKSGIDSGKLWQCPSCKKANAYYVTTCSCGTPKPTSVYADRKDLEKWTCVNCGCKNTIHKVICTCGMKKSENDAKTAAGEKWVSPESSEQSDSDKINNLDVLKKYKELLDMEAITQEEYDLKKSELL